MEKPIKQKINRSNQKSRERNKPKLDSLLKIKWHESNILFQKNS